jgi:hypothetical protein
MRTSGNWRMQDMVEILELNGIAALAQVTKFRIDRVFERPGPSAVVERDLERECREHGVRIVGRARLRFPLCA